MARTLGNLFGLLGKNKISVEDAVAIALDKDSRVTLKETAEAALKSGMRAKVTAARRMAVKAVESKDPAQGINDAFDWLLERVDNFQL